MITSKLSYRFSLVSLVFFVILNIIIIPICTTEYEWDHVITYEFNSEQFMIAEIFVIVFCIVVFYFTGKDKLKITINGNEIKVQKLFSSKIIEFELLEISAFQYRRSSGGFGIGGSRQTAQSTNKIVIILFSDGSELPISNFDYKNHEEFKEFFYTYCKKNGLIKETTAQINRRKRLIGKK